MSLGNLQQLFYIPNEASFVFTQALRGNKGSDASNLYDEEVDDNVYS
jgi:H/ACA ribonucleoprotein complex non-core subunit NAF1